MRSRLAIRPGKTAISVAFNDRCDMIVATVACCRTIERRPSSPASWNFSVQRGRVALGRGYPRAIARRLAEDRVRGCSAAGSRSA